MMIPVEGHPNLYRDENSGAIINYDAHSYNQYMNIKKNKENQQQEINQLKNDINEIKSILKELLNGYK